MEKVAFGNLSLDERNVAKIYNDGKYVVTYSGVYQVHYSSSQNLYYGVKIIEYTGIVKRGTYAILSAKEINEFIGKKILNE